MDAGILLFALVAVFQLVTLPVEYNASSRAVATLSGSGMVSAEEERGVRKVLSAGGSSPMWRHWPPPWRTCCA